MSWGDLYLYSNTGMPRKRNKKLINTSLHVCDSIHFKFYIQCHPCKTSARKHLVPTVPHRQSIYELNNTFTVPTDSSLLVCDTITGQDVTNISKNCNAFIFMVNQSQTAVFFDCLTLKIAALQSLKMSGSTHPVTHSHITEKLNLL